MSKKVKRVLSLLFILFIINIIFLSVKDINKESKESDIDGKDVSKEEYLYKDDLLDKGYSIDEINQIQSKLSLNDVKAYLIGNEKYDNIGKFITNPYFNIMNISRYIKYYKNNPNYSFDQIVLYVEIGLDKDFYTNIKTIDNYNDIDAIVNKYNKLPYEVKYDDLVVLNKPYSIDGKIMIRKVILDKLTKMIDDASKDNIKLFVVSGYRTYDKQSSLFNYSKNKNGIKHALLYSAKPLHSEHELGLAVDFNSTLDSFKNSKEYAWLKLNAYKYGFIERYPKGKENITGFGYEPWHYRYLGFQITTKLYQEDITYEEYLVKYKK